ncbi:hypothetical protein ACFZAD_24465 [Streptomyces iakyrus]|uniref:hypothetical protein n=1 Tax=Streptomyces iakyrus TaxID=68219 RepID=UPI0036F153A7
MSALSDAKVVELKTRLKTIENMSSAADTRELCQVVMEVLNLLDNEGDRELGFSAGKKDDA